MTTSNVERVFLSIGSNLGDRHENIRQMRQLLMSYLIPPITTSMLMETQPLQMEESAGWFLNQIICGGYEGNQISLLKICWQIEAALGRGPHKPLTSRTADIDILLFGDKIIHSDILTIPHASLLCRRFCLEGIRQLAPKLIFPGLHQTIEELVEKMNDSVKSQVIRFLSF